jgi:hypothetical protein
MEKLLYVVWKPEDVSAGAFRSRLVGDSARKLQDLGAEGLAVSVADDDVAYAQGSVITRIDVPIAAIVSFWLDTHLARSSVEAVIRDATSRYAGYLVSESVPIVNTTCRVPLGQRTPGVHTIAFLEKPDRLSYDEWLELWQGQHTRVAIETQSTFLYIQNVVVRALTDAAPPWVAIVEEGFPADALRDPMVFYAAGGSEQKLAANRGRMVESCRRFIDFDRLESHMFSQYVLGD